MGNILSILKEIFMFQEDNSAKVGLSYLKECKTPIEKSEKKYSEPKELRLSELMRRSSY